MNVPIWAWTWIVDNPRSRGRQAFPSSVLWPAPDGIDRRVADSAARVVKSGAHKIAKKQARIATGSLLQYVEQ